MMASLKPNPLRKGLGIFLFVIAMQIHASGQVALNIAMSVSDTSALSAEAFFYSIDFAISSPKEAGQKVVITDTLPPYVDFKTIANSPYIKSFVFDPSTRCLQLFLLDPLPAGTTGNVQVNCAFSKFITPNGYAGTNKATITASNASTSVVSNTSSIVARASGQYYIYKELDSYNAQSKIVTWKTYLMTGASFDCGYPGLLGIKNIMITDTLPSGGKFIAASNGGKETVPGSGIVVWDYASTPFPYCSGQSYIFLNTVSIQYPNTPYGADVFNRATLTATLVGDLPYHIQSDTAKYRLSPPLTEAQCYYTPQRYFSAYLNVVGDTTSTMSIPFQNTGTELLDSVVLELPIPDQVEVIKPFYADTAGRPIVYFTTNLQSGIRRRASLGAHYSGPYPIYPEWKLPPLQPNEYIDKLYVVYYKVPPLFIGQLILDNLRVLPNDRKGNKVVPTKPYYPLFPCDGIGTCVRWTATLKYATASFASSSSCFWESMPKNNEPRLVTVQKGITTPRSFVPGDTVEFQLYTYNKGEALLNTVLIDSLPNQLEYIPNTSIAKFYKESEQRPHACTPTITKNGQVLTFDFASDTNVFAHGSIAVTFKARIKANADAGSCTNTFYGGADNYPFGFYPSNAITYWKGGATFVINKVTGMVADKGVKGILDNSYLFYPSNATTVNGSEVSYKLRIRNTGNTTYQDIVMVDPLPFKGDDKGSTFTPFMISLPIANQPQVLTYYALDSNICIREISPAINPSNCIVPNWSLTPPAELKQVKALKFISSSPLKGGDSLTVTWKMSAPSNLQTLDTAYNHFHYQARKTSDSTLLLTTSPNKVGITISKKARVGEYAWYDKNHNGVRDEDPFEGISGLKVQLWELGADRLAFTSDDVLLDSTITKDKADEPGYYGFTANPGTYYVQFKTNVCNYHPTTRKIRPDFRSDTFHLTSSQIRTDINIGFDRDSITITTPPITCLGGSLLVSSQTNSGHLLAYQWQVSHDQGSTWTDVVSQQQKVLTFATLLDADTGTYKLVAAKSGHLNIPKCRTESNPIRISAADSVKAPVFQPVNACKGSTVKLTPTTPPNTGSYFWYKKSLGGAPMSNPLTHQATTDEVYYLIDSSHASLCASKRIPVPVHVMDCDSNLLALDDYYELWNDETLQVHSLNHPLLNDTHSFGKWGTFSFVSPPLNGSIKTTSTGFEYIPSPHFEGEEWLTYQICDSAKKSRCTQAVIHIKVKARGLFFPNGFSPDTDGINDQYIVYNVPAGVTVSVSFFNRWGDLVYKSENYQNDWKGRCHTTFCLGEDLPSGTYYLVARLSNGHKHTGPVTLIR